MSKDIFEGVDLNYDTNGITAEWKNDRDIKEDLMDAIEYVSNLGMEPPPGSKENPFLVSHKRYHEYLEWCKDLRRKEKEDEHRKNRKSRKRLQNNS